MIGRWETIVISGWSFGNNSDQHLVIGNSGDQGLFLRNNADQ